MDKYTKEAAEQIPVGFYRVIGRVYPSDLAWSWTSKEWIRVDSPDWLIKPGPYASMSVCVIRDKYAETPLAKQVDIGPGPVSGVPTMTPGQVAAYEAVGWGTRSYDQPELFTK